MLVVVAVLEAGGERGGVERDGLRDGAAGVAGPDLALAFAALVGGVRLELVRRRSWSR